LCAASQAACRFRAQRGGHVPVAPVYDLVFAAASLHWTQPGHRWARIAAMLRYDGIFASFGGQMELATQMSSWPCVPPERNSWRPRESRHRTEHQRTARCSGLGANCCDPADSRTCASRKSNAVTESRPFNTSGTCQRSLLTSNSPARSEGRCSSGSSR
jgi:hypothetical protein